MHFEVFLYIIEQIKTEKTLIVLLFCLWSFLFQSRRYLNRTLERQKAELHRNEFSHSNLIN